MAAHPRNQGHDIPLDEIAELTRLYERGLYAQAAYFFALTIIGNRGAARPIHARISICLAGGSPFSWPPL